jgi:hypothetical protein
MVSLFSELETDVRAARWRRFWLFAALVVGCAFAVIDLLIQ